MFDLQVKKLQPKTKLVNNFFNRLLRVKYSFLAKRVNLEISFKNAAVGVRFFLSSGKESCPYPFFLFIILPHLRVVIGVTVRRILLIYHSIVVFLADLGRSDPQTLPSKPRNQSYFWCDRSFLILSCWLKNKGRGRAGVEEKPKEDWVGISD